MIVRIRFGHGRLVTRRKGKNGHAARVTASLLGLVAISFAVFGFWRLCEDLGFAGDFVFSTGLLSHWQVWMAAGAATQYVCWRLTRYSRLVGSDESAPAEEEETPAEKITARV
jgi:hypothetical protein